MKKFCFLVIAFFVFKCELYSQITDTASLRAAINAWVVPSANLTGTKLNTLLNGIHKFLKPNAATTTNLADSAAALRIIANIKDTTLFGYLFKVDTIGDVQRLSVDSVALAGLLVGMGGSGYTFGNGVTGYGKNIKLADSLISNWILNLNGKTIRYSIGSSDYLIVGDDPGNPIIDSRISIGVNSTFFSMLPPLIRTKHYNSFTKNGSQVDLSETGVNILQLNDSIATRLDVGKGKITLTANDSLLLKGNIPFSSTSTDSIIVISTTGRLKKIAKTAGVGGGINMVFGERFTGSSSTTLTFAQNYTSGTIRCFKNGVRLDQTTDFTEATSNTITLIVPRLTTDIFLIDYNY